MEVALPDVDKVDKISDVVELEVGSSEEVITGGGGING
jgi:hypothetical protein